MDTDIPINQDPIIGRTLGGCFVEHLLGIGATGTVYRARQISLDRPVAIKILHPHIALHEVVVNRFAREARAAASLQHPNLVQIFDFGQQDDLYYYTMELVDGSSLGDYLRAGRAFDEPWCRHIARQAISALDLAHGAGIIHRDVKPDNMILDSKGILKISDLGLARIGLDEQAQSLTMTGETLGTPYYMSPEQVQDSRLVDYRSDYYSLGATLFHLVTGLPPFEGETRFSVMTAHVSSPPPLACEANAEISKGFSEFIWWLMQKSPEARPASAAEMLGALDALDRNQALSLPAACKISGMAPDSPKKNVFPGAKAALIAVEILLVALLVGSAFVLYDRSRNAAPKTPDRSASASPAPAPPAPGAPANPSSPPFPQAPQIVIQPPPGPSIAMSAPTIQSLTLPRFGTGHPPVAPSGASESPLPSPSRPPASGSEPGEASQGTLIPQFFSEMLSPEYLARQTAAYGQAADDRRRRAESDGMRLFDLFEVSPPVLTFLQPLDEGPIFLRRDNPLIIRAEGLSGNTKARPLITNVLRGEEFKANLILCGVAVFGFGSIDVFTNLAPSDRTRQGKRRVATVRFGPGRGQVFSFPMTEAIRQSLESGSLGELQIHLNGDGLIILCPTSEFKAPFSPRLELQGRRAGAVRSQMAPR